MAEYQALNGSIHDDDEGRALHLLPQGCVLLTPEQAAALRAPKPLTNAEQKAAILLQIDSLESATKMNRFVREAMILISVQQAVGIGVTEPQLYAANLGYRKVKDLDDQITTLRLQMEAL